VYLSQLEILGFKSFPEKTVLDFNGDVTAVVGPNGCGKTNILDSIRWVLGEQRTSALRSSKMEEVIFNGTAQLKPLGLAEVNLTIKNNRGVLPIEYDEIVITRRLYRSGESEYLLNKSQCRLKDIMELFYDTGMGPHAYSVIQQGMIDAILSDKAEDRRGLFEEAAGVTKYKHRKKEAIAKLEATRADLLRLGDIILEIEKQVNQLRRQAAKARQFSRFKDELKNIEMALASSTLFDTQAKFKDIEGRKVALQFEVGSLNAEFEKRELNLQETRLQINEHERLASEQRQKVAEMSSRASEIEGEIKLGKHKSETAARDVERSNSEIVALESRIASLSQGIEQNDSRLELLAVEKSSLAEQVAMVENDLAGRMAEHLPRETTVNDLRERNAAATEKISALKAEHSSIAQMRENLEQKLREIQADTAVIDQSRNAEQDSFVALEHKRQELDADAEEINRKQAELVSAIESLENSQNQLRESIAQNRAELSGHAARKELLGQLIETGEGYSSGAKTLMSWAGKPSGMMLPLVEVLQVPEQYRVAVSSALGELGEVIPVRNLSDAEAGIEYLKENGGGRASFLILERLESSSKDVARPSNGVPGFVGFADTLIKFPDEYRSAVDLLLGRSAIFENKELMLSINGDWRQYSLVSLDGYLMSPESIVTGGKSGQTVLGRRQDLAEVTSQISQLNELIISLEGKFAENLKTLQSQRDEQAANDKTIRRFEDDKRKIDAELGQLKFDFKERDNKYSAAIGQARSITGEIAAFDERLGIIKSELAELENHLRQGSDELSVATAELLAFRGSVSQLESRLTEARIKTIEHDSLTSKLKSDVEHAMELRAEAEKMIASHRATINSAEETISSSTAKNEELETTLYDIFAERREIQTGLRAIEDKITELMEETGRIDDELSVHRKAKDKLTDDLHILELELQDLQSNRRSIFDRLRMEFNISTLDPNPLPEGRTAESLKGEADEIRQKLQRMDPVNLVAAEDYEREKDRLEFLVRQRDDLVSAEESLKEAISRINTTAEERFRETYAKIQENFESVFTTLFEGGEARIELEEPGDPLESAIRILARPGGKRMLSVAQLSGGERALTAISLLFAIYLVKPSPFCILDEVDAPLDDANLMRFLKIIKRFSESTQFIIITHNKLTMEASDVLYGVTMETPGVSKVVSVKFGDGNGNGNGNGLGGKE
jgi:chromosome segregation protein